MRGEPSAFAPATGTAVPTRTASFRVGYGVANVAHAVARRPGPPLESHGAAWAPHSEGSQLAALMKSRHPAAHAAHAEKRRGLAWHQAGGGSGRDSDCDGGRPS